MKKFYGKLKINTRKCYLFYWDTGTKVVENR